MLSTFYVYSSFPNTHHSFRCVPSLVTTSLPSSQYAFQFTHFAVLISRHPSCYTHYALHRPLSCYPEPPLLLFFSTPSFPLTHLTHFISPRPQSSVVNSLRISWWFSLIPRRLSVPHFPLTLFLPDTLQLILFLRATPHCSTLLRLSHNTAIRREAPALHYS